MCVYVCICVYVCGADDVLQNTVGGGKPKMMHYFNNDVSQVRSSHLKLHLTHSNNIISMISLFLNQDTYMI